MKSIHTSGAGKEGRERGRGTLSSSLRASEIGRWRCVYDWIVGRGRDGRLSAYIAVFRNTNGADPEAGGFSHLSIHFLFSFIFYRNETNSWGIIFYFTFSFHLLFYLGRIRAGAYSWQIFYGSKQIKGRKGLSPSALFSWRIRIVEMDSGKAIFSYMFCSHLPLHL